ncbi:MAG: hypothetical protein Ta2A_03900 [Treponemataceae bacterium]|nr:MAG: hypothetical protein Ta2A_03900 [Treponemataceae bacterium]
MANKNKFSANFFPYLAHRVEKYLSLNASGDINYDADFSVHLISMWYVFFISVAHAVFIFYAVHTGIFLFALNHIIAFCVCLVCYLLVKFHKYVAAGCIFFLDAEVFTILTIYWFGIGNYIFLALILIIIFQIVVDYSSYAMRVTIVAISVLTIAAITFYDVKFGHKTNEQHVTLTLFVLCLLLWNIGILVTLFLGNTLKKVIEQMKIQQINALEKHAYTDALTGLHNRRFSEHFFSVLVEKQKDSFFLEDEEGSPMCVAMIDIDNFKRVNDTYGHAIGDVVLIDLAKILSKKLRYNDTVIRYGGEEFLIILNNVNLLAAENVLEKLRSDVAQHTVSAEDVELTYTITIGVALLKIDNIQKSIEACDKKLYEGKTSGKNKVVI